MIIDNERGFDTAEDELGWTKIINIFPYATDNSKTTHIVKYYKTESDEEYYLFEYIMADNNGSIVNDFNGYQWSEIIKQIDFPLHCFIYSQNIVDKNYFGLVTMGSSIKMLTQDYKNEQETKIYELEHRK
jgi:hypothetical protein